MGKMPFWGTLEGRGQQVERGGSAASGLEVEAAGWSGRIRVRVYQDMEGRDCFDVEMLPHWNDSGRRHVLASGLLDYKTMEEGAYIPALIA